MGSVYEAEHLSLGRHVALKVLRDEHASSADLKARFEREARMLSQLSHPNVITVTDFGVDGAQPFLVMDLQGGRDLTDLLAEGPLPPARAIELARQILRGVAHAHRQGLVHRDLKPQNVRVDVLEDGSDHAVVLDFGLARTLASDATMTRTGIVVGTPAYMAPEQASGGRADERADVYAMGGVLFELLAGRRPFPQREAHELLRAHLLTTPPTLAEVAPHLDVSPALDALVARSLAKEPAARFANAAEMLEALDRVPVPTLRGAPMGPPIGAPTAPFSGHAEDSDTVAASPSGPARGAAAHGPGAPAVAVGTPGGPWPARPDAPNVATIETNGAPGAPRRWWLAVSLGVTLLAALGAALLLWARPESPPSIAAPSPVGAGTATASRGAPTHDRGGAHDPARATTPPRDRVARDQGLANDGVSDDGVSNDGASNDGASDDGVSDDAELDGDAEGLEADASDDADSAEASSLWSDIPLELQPFHQALADGQALTRNQERRLGVLTRRMPSDPRPPLLLGRHYVSQRSFSTSIRYFEQAVARAPRALARDAWAVDSLLTLVGSEATHRQAAPIARRAMGPLMRAELRTRLAEADPAERARLRAFARGGPPRAATKKGGRRRRR